MITQTILKDLLDYDEQTGCFRWKVSRGRTAKAGQIAGCPDLKGYIRIAVCGRPYAAHRLAWLYITGDWPADQIDHINRNRADNRIANLRPCTNAENCQNRKTLAGAVTKCRGVTWHKHTRQFAARIQVNGRRIHLGYFRNIPEAAAICEAARREHYGEFWRGQ